MLDRTIAPPFQKTIAISLPDPTEIDLSAGRKIYFLTGLKQQIVKIEVIFNAGKWVETKSGVSHFSSMMLEKGTVHKSSVEIAATLDLYGASLEISPGFDFVSVSLYSLRDKIKEVFPLFIEILREPVFAEEELTQMRDIFIQNLKINNEKTSFLASKFIRKNIFGEEHPYGSSVDEADALSIEPADLSLFFKDSFKVQSAYILGELDDATLGFIEQGLKSLRVSDDVVNSQDRLFKAPFAWQSDKEGRLQSTLRLGKRSVLRSDPDYADLLLATHLLGGYFGSRLMKNIREDKGLTYGISSSLNAFKHDSMFVIGADVNKENVSLALTEIKKELTDLMTKPVSLQELNLAKNHFIGSLQTDMANLFSVEEKLKNIHLNGLQKNFYADLLIRIDQITPSEVLSTAEKHFGVDSLFEVVVG